MSTVPTRSDLLADPGPLPEEEPAPTRMCATCRRRLDAVLWSVGRHPGCGSYEAGTQAADERHTADHARTLPARVGPPR